MTKVVIHTEYGGFTLSKEALDRLKKMKNRKELYDYELDRDDPHLIEVVESMGDRAGMCLKVVTIPDDVKWHISEYDGNEWVSEDHRTWS
jgi:hypothetical protein